MLAKYFDPMSVLALCRDVLGTIVQLMFERGLMRTFRNFALQLLCGEATRLAPVDFRESKGSQMTKLLAYPLI